MHVTPMRFRQIIRGRETRGSPLGGITWRNTWINWQRLYPGPRGDVSRIIFACFPLVSVSSSTRFFEVRSAKNVSCDTTRFFPRYFRMSLSFILTYFPRHFLSTPFVFSRLFCDSRAKVKYIICNLGTYWKLSYIYFYIYVHIHFFVNIILEIPKYFTNHSGSSS